jgi:hypothetical protein
MTQMLNCKSCPIIGKMKFFTAGMEPLCAVKYIHILEIFKIFFSKVKKDELLCINNSQNHSRCVFKPRT